MTSPEAAGPIVETGMTHDPEIKHDAIAQLIGFLSPEKTAKCLEARKRHERAEVDATAAIASLEGLVTSADPSTAIARARRAVYESELANNEFTNLLFEACGKLSMPAEQIAALQKVLADGRGVARQSCAARLSKLDEAERSLERLQAKLRSPKGSS